MADNSGASAQPVVITSHGQMSRSHSVQIIQQPNVMTTNGSVMQQPNVMMIQNPEAASAIQTVQSPTSNIAIGEQTDQSVPQPTFYIISAPQPITETEEEPEKPITPCYYGVWCFFAVVSAIFYSGALMSMFSKYWIVAEGVKGGLFQICFEDGVDTNASWGFTITPDLDTPDQMSNWSCELTTDIITTGEDRRAIILMSIGSVTGGLVLITYICTGASVMFQYMTSAMLVAASEHFVSGIVASGFSRNDLGLAYVITMAVAVNFGLVATIRVGTAGALGVITVTLRPRNVAFKSKKRKQSTSSKSQQAAPVIIQMAQSPGVPETSSQEIVPTETLKEAQIQTEEEQDIHQQKNETITENKTIISDINEKDEVTENKESTSDVNEKDVGHRFSAITDEFNLPSWLSWILIYICCIKPRSNKVDVERGDHGSEHDASESGETNNKLSPFPFCCFPRSIMCDCVTELDDTGDSTYHEINNASLNLPCCGKLAPIPRQLCSCIVVTASGRIDPVNDVTTCAESHIIHPVTDVTSCIPDDNPADDKESLSDQETEVGTGAEDSARSSNL